jgi:hypothetical protein
MPNPGNLPFSGIRHCGYNGRPFFETLASNRPASLRKLHQLPGSAIFIDEAHAALPAHLWPQGWRVAELDLNGDAISF